MKAQLFLFSLAGMMCLASCKKPPTTSTDILATTNSPARAQGHDYFLLTSISDDKTYGVTAENPINVGGGYETGVQNQRTYLNSILGPNGEPIRYQRLGSCCSFRTSNNEMGLGMLDQYQVTWEGQRKPVVLFINLYDEGPLEAPKGFSLRINQE